MARVVVADDQGPVRRSLARAMRAKGHIVMQAANGHEVLHLLRQERVDVVVTDIVMAEMDGLEILQRMRETYPQVPVIVLSGRMVNNYMEIAEFLGAKRCFRKPVDPAALHDAIRELT